MLKVSVKDFGPIVEGSVELKPLTVFIGPSNVGKSYLATAVYSLFQALGGRLDPAPNLYTPLERYISNRPRGRRAVIEAIRALQEWLEGPGRELVGKQSFPFSQLPAAAQGEIKKVLTELLEEIGPEISRVLVRCFGDLSGISRRTATKGALQIAMDREQPPLHLRLEASNGELHSREPAFDLADVTPLVTLREYRRLLMLTTPGMAEDVLGFLVASSWFTLLQGFRASYYLPAARSGIAQGHKAIASILVRQSSFAAIEPLEVPTLSGVITDFIGHILTLERRGRRESPLEDVVTFFERQVVQGRVDIEQAQKLLYPEITYEPFPGQPAMGNFPLARTSSMVSELAPVVLFLKYLVRPGDLVILEEPESHLHPAAQRQMARGIVRLVNKGVKLLVTTHSDYLVGQLNNLMRLRPRRASKLGYEPADCLKPEDVAAYEFAMNEEAGGSFVKEIPITADEGISEEEFTAVAEALYREAISLERR